MSDLNTRPLEDKFAKFAYMGPIEQMPSGSFGWISPNRLRRDRDHLFIQRATAVISEMVGDRTLVVMRLEDMYVVNDEFVFCTDRWWNGRHTDAYHYPSDYGTYVRELRRGAERHRPPVNGRIPGSVPWSDQRPAFSGSPHELPMNHYGFVPASSLRGDAANRSIYLQSGTVIVPSMDDNSKLVVSRLQDGIFVYDADVPEEQRWWNRSKSDGYCAFRDSCPTYVKGLIRN